MKALTLLLPGLLSLAAGTLYSQGLLGQNRVEDHTAGQSSICPVHHLAMHKQQTAVIRGGPMIEGTLVPAKIRAAEFPFAESKAYTGCVISSTTPKTALFYVCPACLATERKWQAEHRR